MCINELGSGRFNSLNHLFNISNTMHSSIDTLLKSDFVSIDYEHINKIIEQEQEKAINFLKGCMK